MIASYPAYDITSQTDVLVHGEQYAVFQNANFSGDYRLVTAGSVVGFYGEDEIYNPTYNPTEIAAMIEREKQIPGAELYWLNLSPITITAHKQERRSYRALFVGQKVNFDGNELTIANAPNRNFKLK